jgi:hypothetical protein
MLSMSVEQFLIFAHIIGTVIGVGGATIIESHLNRARKDGTVSPDESAILSIDYNMMRIGLVIVLLSGFGFLLLDKFTGHTQYLYSPRLWAKIFFVLVIAANTLMLQARAINLYWGTAFSFVSWWAAAFVGMFITHGLRFDFYGDGSGFITTFATLMTIYAVAVILGAIILNAIRKRNSVTA